jgi:hypothetical protein
MTKPLNDQAFRDAVVRLNGNIKDLAKEFGVSSFKIHMMLDVCFKPSEIAKIREARFRK